jgi:hypothetical protein
MNTKLRDILGRQFTTVEEIALAFDLCSTRSDIYKVISKIPQQFGRFEILSTDEDYTYFVIQNSINFRGKEFLYVTTHDFYKIGGC